MADASANVSIAIFCAFCHGALELQYERDAHPDVINVTLYECPYCQEQNPLKIPGRVLWVTERDVTKDITDTPKVQ